MRRGGAGNLPAVLVVNGTLNLICGRRDVCVRRSVTFSGSDKITGGVGSTIEISGLITTAGSVNTIDVSNIKLKTGSSGTLYGGGSASTITVEGGSATVKAGGGDDVVILNNNSGTFVAGAIDGGGGSDTLRIASLPASRLITLSGTLSNFERLELNSNTKLTTSLTVSSVVMNNRGSLTGTGSLTVTGNVDSDYGEQLNLSGAITLQGQTGLLRLGDSVVTLNVSGGSHLEGDIWFDNAYASGELSVSVSGTGASDIYSGHLRGENTNSNLSLNNVTFTGTVTGFDSLTVGTGATVLDSDLGSATVRLAFSNSSTGSFSISSGRSLYVSTMTLAADISGAGTLDIAGAVTGSVSVSTELDVATVVLRTGASGGIYFGSNVDDVIFEGVSYSGALSFVSSAATNITLRNGSTLSSAISNSIGDFIVSGEGTNILDVDLTVGGSVTIGGVLQIASGHSLTTGTGAGVSNQVQLGAVLDISQLADSTAGVGTNGITIVAGGVLALGSAENRNASNITLTRGSDVASSSIIKLDLGADATTSSTALFSHLPSFTGTGAVTLEVSGNLVIGLTQMLFAGEDKTAEFRVRSGDPVEVVVVGSDTVLRGINVAPVVSTVGGSSFTVAEKQTSAFTVVASDRNGQTLSYTLGGDDGSLFSVSLSGVVTFNTAPDFDSPSDSGTDNVYNITVTVGDGTVNTVQAYTVTVRALSTLGGTDIANNIITSGNTGTPALVVRGALKIVNTGVSVGSITFNGDATISGTSTNDFWINGAITGTSANTIDLPEIRTNNQSSGTLYAGDSANNILTWDSDTNIYGGGGNDTISVSRIIFTGTVDGGAGMSDRLNVVSRSNIGNTATIRGFEIISLDGAYLNTANDIATATLEITGSTNFSALGGSVVHTYGLVSIGNSVSEGIASRLSVGLAAELVVTRGLALRGVSILRVAGTLDLSAIANRDITFNPFLSGNLLPIDISGGGTLKLGTRKGVNPQYMRFKRGTTASDSAVLSLSLDGSSLTTAVLVSLPAFTGTGTVIIKASSNSLTAGQEQVLISGDHTAQFRVASGSLFEIALVGGNTVLRALSGDVTVTSSSTLTNVGGQDLTDGSSTADVTVDGTFNSSSGNFNILGDIEVQAGATTGNIQANNITVTDATVGNLSLNNTGGKIKLVQSSGGTLTIGTLAGGSSTSDILEVKNDKATALALGTVSTIETLKLTGGAVSGTFSNFTALEVATATSALNSDLSVTSATLYQQVLTGTRGFDSYG